MQLMALAKEEDSRWLGSYLGGGEGEHPTAVDRAEGRGFAVTTDWQGDDDGSRWWGHRRDCSARKNSPLFLFSVLLIDFYFLFGFIVVDLSLLLDQFLV